MSEETLVTIPVENLPKEIWRDYVVNHPNGNVFQTPEIYSIFKKTKGYNAFGFAVLNPNKGIQGILVGHIIHYLKFFSRIVIYGGPLTTNNEVIKTLLDTLDHFLLKKFHIPLIIEIRNLWNTSSYHKYFTDLGYIFYDHLNYLIPLSCDERKLWYSIPKNRRKNIQRGLNKFVIKEVLGGNETKLIKKLISHTYRRAKIPPPPNSLIANFCNTNNSNTKVFIAKTKDSEKVVASRIVLCYKKTVYDWYAGSLYDENSRYSNEAIVWEVLKRQGSSGYEVFDFGGAGDPKKPYGPREFKKRFGGIEVNYGIYRKIYNPFFWKLVKNISKIIYPGIKYHFD